MKRQLEELRKRAEEASKADPKEMLKMHEAEIIELSNSLESTSNELQ